MNKNEKLNDERTTRFVLRASAFIKKSFLALEIGQVLQTIALLKEPLVRICLLG